tara:strand:+ start:3211 stop:4101 length:891 start_codon:yes stop_codon:yes gene_type:complete
MKNKKAIFAVTVRNPSENFIMLVDRFIKIGESFKKFKIIIIESDSDKKTLNKLHEIKNKNNVIVDFLGSLEDKLELGFLRTERIAFARNRFIEIIFKSNELQKYDYLMVFDDGKENDILNYEKISNALSINSNWSAQFANQKFFYYDTYALRKKDWVDQDPVKQLNESYNLNGNFKKSFIQQISKKIRRIRSEENLISVESAFGGFGIYKIKDIEGARYIGNKNGEAVCEHIAFNKYLLNRNKLLFINPKLINSLGINNHIFISQFLIYLIPSFICNWIWNNKSKVKPLIRLIGYN